MKNPLKRFILLAAAFCSVSAYAQDDVQVENVTKITVINPGLSGEFKAGKLETVYAQAFLNSGATIERYDNNKTKSTFYFDPAATLQYRVYYNGAKRAGKELRTSLNSMNYLAAVVETIFSKMPVSDSHIADKRRAINRFGIVWGLQRNYPSRFSLDLNLGLGYLFAKTTYSDSYASSTTSNVGIPTILGQINIGFWLNKRSE